ncbi:AraC family transcriptional regulator [Novosphingobium sp. PhB57]|uniref:helix-turn-helix domain-containing protein n=1 Tax=unclassified Novosphingobium TaxID=2644732 RepID=UPI001049EAFE|nr:helix-turn-helix domain-containing protein [Novosphingobium sp. PhB57]TCU59575.1 AraC family transcriptional regulator [Novosphingobium sp. PhB57]TDW63772.1 AraC family transcriptional regulator [Novosphingobium sp. PhB55]
MTARRVVIQYCPVPAGLDRYLSVLFYCEIELGENERLHDVLFPDWASLRFHFGSTGDGEIRAGSRLESCRFSVTGPRSQEVRFSMATAREWGFGLTPLGWATFLGVPADRYANVLVDGDADPVFAHFKPLHDALAAEDSPGDQLDRLTAFVAAMPRRPVVHEDLILAICEALANPEVRSATDLAARVRAHPRMVERVCRAAFGFPPKLLLRRQRFLRSIEQFTLEPKRKWIGAIDSAYHDQAQFVRDFRAFMGMTPRQYAKLDKPVTGPLMRERARHARLALR